MAGMIVMCGFLRGLEIRWGGDWDEDTQVKDELFNDLFHFEVDDKI
jgi:hypothetical protein